MVCSLTFFAACSSDDDDGDNKNNGNPPEEEAVITAPDVVGTYWGNLDISMIPDGSDQEIVIGDGNADMTINVKVPTLQQTVKVTYSGVKQVAGPGSN